MSHHEDKKWMNEYVKRSQWDIAPVKKGHVSKVDVNKATATAMCTEGEVHIVHSKDIQYVCLFFPAIYKSFVFFLGGGEVEGYWGLQNVEQS